MTVPGRGPSHPNRAGEEGGERRDLAEIQEHRGDHGVGAVSNSGLAEARRISHLNDARDVDLPVCLAYARLSSEARLASRPQSRRRNLELCLIIGSATVRLLRSWLLPRCEVSNLASQCP